MRYLINIYTISNPPQPPHKKLLPMVYAPAVTNLFSRAFQQRKSKGSGISTGEIQFNIKHM
jgi:hypothetical protein